MFTKRRPKSQIRDRFKCDYITVLLRQHNYKHLPCTQSLTQAALMDVIHTGDSMSLSLHHLTTLYLRLLWQRERTVMLMTVGTQTRGKWPKDTCMHTYGGRFTQRDMSSLIPPPKKDDTCDTFQPHSIKCAYIHCTVTLMSPKIPNDTHCTAANDLRKSTGG